MCDSWYSTRSAGAAFISSRNRATSVSLTWILSSTSRSRSRVRRICSRRSSRHSSNDTPSASSARRNSASAILLPSATRCTARSSCSSSTRMPVSRAICSCAFSRIRRSSIWRSSTSRSGAGVFCRRSCRSARPTASFSSESVTTSLLTTATMRSTTVTLCAGAANGKAIKSAAKHPAAGVVLEAGQTFEQALVQNRVIVPPDGVPARRDRPLPRYVDLLERGRRIAVEAVAEVDQLCQLGRIARRHGVALRALIARVVLGGGVEGPVAEQPPAHRGKDIRGVIVAQVRDRRQPDAFVLEVIALSDRGAESFLAAALQEARRQGESGL